MEEYQDNSLKRESFSKSFRRIFYPASMKTRKSFGKLRSGKSLESAERRSGKLLRQLELEGLVAIIPNKGAYVTSIKARMWRRHLSYYPLYAGRLVHARQPNILRRNRSKTGRNPVCRNFMCKEEW